MLVGGGIGYLSYNFKEIPSALRSVWQKMPERQKLKEGVGEVAKILAMIPVCAVALCFYIMALVVFVVWLMSAAAIVLMNLVSYLFLVLGIPLDEAVFPGIWNLDLEFGIWIL